MPEWLAHMSISDDNDVARLRDGCLQALIHTWSRDTTLVEQVVLRHAHWLPAVHIWWNSLTEG